MVSQRQTNVGQKAASQHVHMLFGCQFNRVTQGIFGLARVIARNHLDLTAQQTACHVNLFNRQLPALLVRQRELGNGRVAVDFADFDGQLVGTVDHGCSGQKHTTEQGLFRQFHGFLLKTNSEQRDRQTACQS